MANFAKKPGEFLNLVENFYSDHTAIVRDELTETFGALESSYAAHGLLLREARPATAEQLARSHSTWAKRLGAGSNRPVWSARFERAACPAEAG